MHFGSPSTLSVSSELNAAQRSIDALLDREQDAPVWEPAKPPEVLGEFLDSRHMLPLLLPSDPRMLSAAPKRPSLWKNVGSGPSQQIGTGDYGRSASRTSRRNADSIPWYISSRRLRRVGLETLRWVDGIDSVSRWSRPWHMGEIGDDSYEDAPAPPPFKPSHSLHASDTSSVEMPWVSSLTEKPSLHTRGRSGTVMLADSTDIPV